MSEAIHHVLQCYAVDQLHCVVLQILVFADAVDRNDIGMVKACCRFGFATKTGTMLTIARD